MELDWWMRCGYNWPILLSIIYLCPNHLVNTLFDSQLPAAHGFDSCWIAFFEEKNLNHA